VRADRPSTAIRSSGKCGQKVNLARVADLVEQPGGAQLAIDGYSYRMLQVAALDEVLAESRELTVKIVNDLTDVAAARINALPPHRKFT
jgi:hypothetical protein